MELDAMIRLYMNNAVYSAFMMTNLINDLLDQAKLENQAFRLNNDYINLIDIVSEAFNVVRFQAENQGVKLLIEFDQMRPNLFTRVYSDQKRLLQMILNFVSNSLKFTPNNGFIKVALNLLEEQVITKSYKNLNDSEIINADHENLLNPIHDEEKYIKFAINISDSGMGISKENIKKLFNDYGTLDEHREFNT